MVLILAKNDYTIVVAIFYKVLKYSLPNYAEAISLEFSCIHLHNLPPLD